MEANAFEKSSLRTSVGVFLLKQHCTSSVANTKDDAVHEVLKRLFIHVCLYVLFYTTMLQM